MSPLPKAVVARRHGSTGNQELSKETNPAKNAASSSAPLPDPSNFLAHILLVASFFLIPGIVYLRGGKLFDLPEKKPIAEEDHPNQLIPVHQDPDPSPSHSSGSGEAYVETNKINPFIYDSPLTLYETIKRALGALILLPLRVTLLMPALVFTYLFAKLSIAGLSSSEDVPMAAWRRVLFLYPCRLMVRYIMFVMGFYHISIKGEPATRRQAPVVVANHVSFVDPFFLFITYLPAFVAKKEVTSLPVVGTVALALQCLLVDRQSINSRKDTLNLILKRSLHQAVPSVERLAEHKEKDQEVQAAHSSAAVYLDFLEQLYTLPQITYLRCFGEDEYSQVVIFPEGTTTNGKAMIAFHQGAFVPGVPIQPVLIRYPHHHFDPSFPVGATLPQLMFGLLSQIINHMEIEFLDVYQPSEEEKKNPALYAHNVRALMAEKMNVEVTEYTFEDALLMNEAFALSMKPSQVNIAIHNVKKLYQEMSLNDLKQLLWRFRHIDRDGDGLISYREFAHSLRLPEDSPYTKDLFNLLDTDESGSIDFRKFVVGMASLNRKFNKLQIVELAFSAFDKDGRGYIEKQQLKNLLHEVFPTIEEEELDKLCSGPSGVIPK